MEAHLQTPTASYHYTTTHFLQLYKNPIDIGRKIKNLGTW